uniref:NADH-ubiquinone oxidoreductase chain 1 n=1 Tax=Phloeosinus perlatus TaxID=2800998 RepID=A0A891GS56_9CUCU|nr:NADH dehydrogenase subunit 1 [Phloeosinus perlatus]QRK25837.1 NADH dehydrogenase subunit 1 [Phloeosinus perlatus]
MLYKDVFMEVFSLLIIVISVLVGVAFLTLFERKVLGYIHIRKGPNKLGVSGILQPFSDAIKLFSKEQMFPFKSNLVIFYLAPVFNLIISLVLWFCIPLISVFLSFEFSLFYVLAISSLGVYTVMMVGWSSNSSYSMFGSIRSVAQMVSYEVSFILILLSFFFYVDGFSLENFFKYQENIWFIFLFFPLSFMMIVSLLAETNRSPFDFSEGESELVSGFNVEYSSGGFAFIFLAEYASILFMGMLSSFILLGSSFYSYLFVLKMGLVFFLWLWVRGTFPRYRYDKLMYLAWKSYLPVSLNLLLLYYSIYMMVMSLIS